MTRREKDRERYANNPEARARQRARQNAWERANRNNRSEYLKRKAAARRKKYAEDPEFREKERARAIDHSFKNKQWLSWRPVPEP